jgi:Na+-translocating ferredoxin:NAD+ oxidoreductase subunit B
MQKEPEFSRDDACNQAQTGRRDSGTPGSIRIRPEATAAPMPILDPAAIDAALPQTQCTQCGYAGCLPYAQAIAGGVADINQCPPGGDEVILALAAITGLMVAPLNPAHGAHRPRVVAVIDEAQCIGCTICIQKCPVDAIVGAAKVMHTVIAAECTGCELCVAPCPVDCIALVAMPSAHPAITDKRSAAAIARDRHRARLARLSRQAEERIRRKSALAAATAHAQTAAPAVGTPEHKRNAIAGALARARARRDRADTP